MAPTLVALVLLVSLVGCLADAYAQCVPIPPDQRIDTIRQNASIVGMVMQGRPNPNKDDNGPAAPRTSLRELLDADIIPTRAMFGAHATLLAFQKESVQSRDTRVIPIPIDAFQCLVQPGDKIILSYGDQQHVTAIGDFDAAREKFGLLDPWPKDFNLIPSTFDGAMNRVDWRHLKRILVRVHTVLTASQVDVVFESIIFNDYGGNYAGDHALKARALNALGAAYEDWDALALTYRAAEAFRQAKESAELANDEQFTNEVVGNLYLALLLSRSWAVFWGEAERVRSIEDELGAIVANFPEQVVWGRFGGRKAFNVAQGTYISGDYESTLRLLESGRDFGDATDQAQVLRFKAYAALSRLGEVESEIELLKVRLRERALQLKRRVDALQAGGAIFNATHLQIETYAYGRTAKLVRELGELQDVR